MIQIELINESDNTQKIRLFTEKEAIEEASRKKCIVAYY